MMRTYSELLELVENQELVKYTAEADNYESMLSEMSQTIAEIIKWSTSSQNRRSATPKLSWETTLQGLDTTFEDLESEDDEEDPRKATKLSLSQQVDQEGIPDGATGNVTSTPKSKQINTNAAPYDPAQLFRRPDTSGLPADQQDFAKSVYQTQMRLLPQLKLSRFSGSKSDHFDTWFCHFQTLVESQAVLGNKAKYLYLLECIEGTAKELVLSTTAGLIEEDSYEMALNTLTKCFGGPTQSTLQIITKFHELTPLTTRSRMEISRVYVCFKGIQNYHKKKENHHELEEISSSLLIKGREKIGRFIREFDAWRLDNALPHSFNSLVRWLERMQEAAQDAFIFSGHSHDQKPRKERHSQKMSNNSNNAKTQQGLIGRKEEKEEKFECSTGCNFKRFHKLPWCNNFKRMTAKEKLSHLNKIKGCLRCLGTSHKTKECQNSPRKCNKEGCEANHHFLLHEALVSSPKSDKKENTNSQKKKNEKKKKPQKDGSTPQGNAQQNTTTAKRRNNYTTAIMVGHCEISSGSKKVIARVLLDSGSTTTGARNALSREVGAEIVERDVTYDLGTFGGKQHKKVGNIVKFNIRPIGCNSDFRKYGASAETFEIQAFCMDELTTPTDVVDWSRVKARFPHLREAKAPRVPKTGVIDVLIGSDYAALFVPHKTFAGAIDEPVCMLNRLGWFFQGRYESTDTRRSLKGITANCQLRRKEDDMLEMVTNYWNMDEPVPNSVPKSKEEIQRDLEDLKAKQELPKEEPNHQRKVLDMKTFSAKNRQFETPHENLMYSKMEVNYDEKEERYVASIPWKNTRPNLRSNRSQMKGIQSNILSSKQLKKKGVTIQELQEIIDSYLEKGYIRKLTDQDLSDDSYYIMNFPVVDRSRASTKIRMVFDCSNKIGGRSINEEAHVGPNLLVKYTKVIMRFRMYEVCLVSDISEMYLRILLNPVDRSYFRFFFGDGDKGDLNEYEFNVTTFGGNCMPSISQKVKSIACEEHGQNKPEGVDTLENATYMDDSGTSRPSVDEAMVVYKEMKEILGKAGMKPVKWMSNSKAVLEQIPEEERSKQVKTMGKDLTIDDSKILGLIYKPNEDIFSYVGDATPGGKTNRSMKKKDQSRWTKRNILSVIMKLYDPCGFLGPYIIRAKLILQRIMIAQIGWEDPIPQKFLEPWEKWIAEIPSVSQIQVPRHLGVEIGCNLQVHMFVDASIEALCSVFYLRVRIGTKVLTRMIRARTKVTPSATQSVARLELAACDLGVQDIETILDHLNLRISVHSWTDSMDCLWWLLQISKMWKPYVANRVGRIQRLSNLKLWQHVDTKNNPADLGTRGATIEELSQSKLWWEGPEFLKQDEENWPKKVKFADLQAKEETKNEIRQVMVLTGQLSQNKETAEDKVDYLDPKRFSVGKLYDGYVQLRERALKLLPNRSLKHKNQQIVEADKLLIRMSQIRSYEDVIDALKAKKPLPKKHALIKYRPYLDEEGILRSQSRLQNQDILPEETRRPILLSAKDDYTKLLVSHWHRRLKHPCSADTVRAHLMKSYIIPSYYFVERRVLKSCLDCKLASGKAESQVMAPLPASKHSKPLRAFTRVGLDYMGPFRVKEKKETRSSRERPKHYGLIFVCFQTRAVHIEVTPFLDTSATFNAISRFCDRRGVPEELWSDNQTSFKSTNKELQEIIQKVNFADLEKKTEAGYKDSKYGIKWNFITSRSPHHGGVWEAAVKSSKRAMKAVYGNAELSLDELNTCMSNAERLLNARPIGASDQDPMKSPPLTPNHFLVGRNGSDLAPPESESDSKLLPRWRHIQRTQDHFWKRWQEELLSELHPTKKWTQERRNIREGDLVAEIERDQPRDTWKIACVDKVMPGSDGNIRSVQLRYKDGSHKKSRPVTKLLLLEPCL